MDIVKQENRKMESIKEENFAIRTAAYSYAKRKLVTEVYTSVLRKELFEGTFFQDQGLIPDDVVQEFRQLTSEKDNKKEEKRKGKYVLCTINPTSDVTLEELSILVEKIVKKVWIQDYIYCYETRGDEKGLHCHLFFYREDKLPSHVEREIKNTLKSIDSGNSHFLNFKYFKDQDAPNGYNYVKGIKGGTVKKNHDSDISFRKKNNLADYYTSHGLLSETGKQENGNSN